MTQWLCISVTLLDGRFHGQRSVDEPEWPPSPWRLYQALLAGGQAGCRSAEWSDSDAAALRCLAAQAPPEMIAPVGQAGQAYTLWVPNNDHDVIWRAHAKHSEPKRTAADLRTAKHVRPTLLLEAPEADPTASHTIHWLYSLGETAAAPDRLIDHVSAIQRLASAVHTLGWGMDSAVAHAPVVDTRAAAMLSGQRWHPLPSGVVADRALRVPRAGALEELLRCHDSFANQLAGGVYTERQKPDRAAYGVTCYVRSSQAPARPAAAFALRPADGSAEWFRGNPARLNQIAAMVRHIACAYSRPESRRFPGGSEAYVRGKLRERTDNPQRFSYLPLPTIRDEHGDGLIRRVLIAEEAGGTGQYAHWAAERLRGAPLIDENTGQCVAILELLPPSDDVIRRYLRRSCRWATVTPVILPGFDDGNGHSRQRSTRPTDALTKAESLLLRALKQAGISADAVKQFTLRKAPFWSGSQHPDAYHRPNYLDKGQGRRFPAWHVELQFHEPLAGPLALGAGRHFGLGLLAAAKER